MSTVIERLHDFIDHSAQQYMRYMERELIWIKEEKNIWWAFQDCLHDPYYKRDTCFYDEDIFILHIVETPYNPNTDFAAYAGRWGYYNLSNYSFAKAMQEFKSALYDTMGIPGLNQREEYTF
jgi:hypothetical protein